MSFKQFNTRAAKVNGEAVMWIRGRYAEMWSYPAIRQGLQQQFGVVLSIQQITRIAKGESFAQLPVLPTDTEVDMTMHLNAMRSQGLPQPSTEEIEQSMARFQAIMAKEAEPRPTVHEILERRTIPTLEEMEARERTVMGDASGRGMDRLMSTVEARSAKAVRLLDELGATNTGDSHDDATQAGGSAKSSDRAADSGGRGP